MINKESVLNAFGGKANACAQIGCSRPTLDAWIEKGEIPIRCGKGEGANRNWHDKIISLGLDPLTLTSINGDFVKPIDQIKFIIENNGKQEYKTVSEVKALLKI